MNVHEINLDVSKQPAVTPVLHLGQGDKSGTTLACSIYDDGTALSLSGKSARLCVKLPDGRSYYEVDGTVSGNVATFMVDETYAAAIAGTTDSAYVEVRQGSTVVCSTSRFRIVVLESAQEGADPAHAYESGIIEATERANEAAEAAEGVVLQSVPTMSANIKGGAKLGSGLAVSDQTLSVDASGIKNGMLPVAHGGTGASTAAAARANLDAAQSENAAGSLYDAEQAIADNAAAIAQLGESVSQRGRWLTTLNSSITFTAKNGPIFVAFSKRTHEGVTTGCVYVGNVTSFGVFVKKIAGDYDLGFSNSGFEVTVSCALSGATVAVLY